MDSELDPIIAIATPPGRGGIGVVRVSGRDLRPIIEGVLGPELAHRLTPRSARFARFLDADGQSIDEGIALLFPAPNSFTGETVLELQGHGGLVVLRLLLARCLHCGASIGARIAQPGEFTRRAFLNNRIDLAQAEAVADLINASTAAAARSAVRSLRGEFSRAVAQIAEELTQLRVLAEASLDFPEEQLELPLLADIGSRLTRALADLGQITLRARQGAMLRTGLHVVIAGAPNVGKSSLLNALAGEDASIVSEHPGTTRDRVERSLEINGLALHMSDTAGLRETADAVERMGIERTMAALEGADVVLDVRDDRGAGGAAELSQTSLAAKVCLRVQNKIDLTGDEPGLRDGRVYVCARSGAGIDALRAQLLRVAGWELDGGEHTSFLARERHLLCLVRAGEHLETAESHVHETAPRWELFAEELRLAGEALGEIAGGQSPDDLLGRIFGQFCIGK